MGVNKRVSLAAQGILPAGFERVTAVLPEYQAYIVNKWAKDAQKIDQGKAIDESPGIIRGNQSRY
jgi:hypothetical protein